VFYYITEFRHCHNLLLPSSLSCPVVPVQISGEFLIAISRVKHTLQYAKSSPAQLSSPEQNLKRSIIRQDEGEEQG